MTRTLLAIVLTALLAAPLALAQGPPPGYTDPLAYAQDYAAEQAAQAQADPVGYAGSRDPVAEADHALWLACWTAYEQAGSVVDPACAPFFTAPVQVDPAMQGAVAEVTQVLNDTGAAALAAEALDAVNDTLADPASALDQVQRIGRAVVAFLRDLVDFVADTLGLGGLALAAGLLGAAQGILDLLQLPAQGTLLALDGLGAALMGTAGAAATAASLVGDAVSASLAAVVAGLSAAAHGAGAGLDAVADGLVAAVQGVADGVGAVASSLADAAAATADAVQDGVRSVTAEVASWFGADKPVAARDDGLLDDAPETGTAADGLIERLLDAV